MTLNSRVHNCWFIVSCLLLGGVLGSATLLTWDLNSYSDKVMKETAKYELGYQK